MIQDRVVAEYEKVAGEPVKTRLQFHHAVSYKAGAGVLWQPWVNCCCACSAWSTSWPFLFGHIRAELFLSARYCSPGVLAGFTQHGE